MAAPRAVRKQADEADRLLRELNAKPGEIDPAADDSTPPADAPAAQPAAAEAPPDQQPSQPSVPAQQPTEDFKQKYQVLRGKYDREIHELKLQVSELTSRGVELERLLSMATAPTVAAPNGHASSLIKPEEITEYGEEFFDIVGRRAREIVQGELAQFTQANQRREQQRTDEQKRGDVHTALNEEVPDWVTINTNPQFLAWLAERDVFSGEVKRKLLTEAFQNGDAARVVQFFKAFQEDSARATPAARGAFVDPGTLLAPGAARGGAPADAPGSGRIWTQGEITQFYADVRRGKIPEADKKSLEKEIIKAAAEGRVR